VQVLGREPLSQLLESPKLGTHDRIMKRHVSLTEAREHNQAAISKIKENSLETKPFLEPQDTQYRLKRLEKIALTAPTLKLRILSSTTLAKNTVISINPLGCDKSLRPLQDGVTYFGCKKRVKSKDSGGEILNDFLIPSSDKSIEDKHRGRHFMIYYSLDSGCYMIQDLAVGLGTFVKIEGSLKLKDNQLLNLGDNFIVVNILPERQKIYPRLRIKLFGGPATGEIYYFNAPEYHDRRVRIGRQSNCEVHLDDHLLSKIQATIFYSTQEGWVLIDGDIENQRPSTNGTW
jgi:hypothetical protein